MENIVRQQIFQLADEEYKKFHSKLCPNANNIVGVRLPLLRKMAKQLAKENWREYIKAAQSDYYEEVMLQGLILGYVKADIEEVLNYVSNFIPKIDNWAICDSFCNGLKFTKANKERVWNFIQPYLSSEREFDVRFGVVMLISFYIEENYIDRVLKVLDKIKHEGYYVKMAIAWAISVCYVKFPEKTMEYLKNNRLDDFTYNKSLQKITESLRVDKETKALIRNMKRR
ncbi:MULTISPECIES: DNA alkylation repair protein [Clostridium]|uniref:DNA alkylation repair enzyme n=2 Tax=Clostridium TaxID=1485 RepID=A0A151AKH1_9CLOT|nr:MULTISPECIES: DNA alkylation repair protein [Clostridium]KYH28133.1 DNA alkylation repair enzyme [Clostridium colicanis DSM 13634]MBE6043079.1 DNA alkylation repair protein [Clostridium thermopalmarium]PRR70547.1 DNA alkylation repair enzyme [Clostridium thermopalmarium DSM 5974]PVZ21265.1 3-methyladenine DNA glycosylase AlkD [Clostridium thermopalmarium DSM 5974]